MNGLGILYYASFEDDWKPAVQIYECTRFRNEGDLLTRSRDFENANDYSEGISNISALHRGDIGEDSQLLFAIAACVRYDLMKGNKAGRDVSYFNIGHSADALRQDDANDGSIYLAEQSMCPSVGLPTPFVIDSGRI